MKTKYLNRSLKEIKDQVPLDYALNRGYYSSSYMIKVLMETYGENANGIYV